MKNNTFIRIIISLIVGGAIWLLLPNTLIRWGIIFFFVLFVIRSVKRKKRTIPTLTKEKKEHYTQLGMTEQEVTFFRDTVNQTKQQIVQLQKNISHSTKLKTIDLRHDTLKASKALFKELVKEPQKLHLANHFLYTNLPNLVDLTTKYLEIEAYEIKNKQTYEKLQESVTVIEQLSKLIKKDYEQFISADLSELDLEISIAKNSLKEDNEF